MLITLFSDASQCHETGVVGYGGWVKSNRLGRGLQFKGVLKEPTFNTAAAEAMSAVNVLYEALKAEAILPGDEVLIQCDSLAALGIFMDPFDQSRRRKTTPELIPVAEMRVKISQANSLRFRTKHVKGHQLSDGSRNSVNNLCDLLAKEAMREARDKRKANGAERVPDLPGRYLPEPALQSRQGREKGRKLPDQVPSKEVGERPAPTPREGEKLSASERRRREIAAPVGAAGDPSTWPLGNRSGRRSL